MRNRAILCILGAAVPAVFVAMAALPAGAYPPAVGVTGKYRNCAACHTDNGPWKNDDSLILDLLDKETGKSLRQSDGTFLVSAKPCQKRTLLAVVGRAKGDQAPAPNRNGWTFIDPALIERGNLGSKFVSGWDVDLSMSCRLVGDKHKAYEGASVTVLPMTVRAGESAKDGELEWQILMTSGTAVKGDANQGLMQNYFERKVKFKVEE